MNDKKSTFRYAILIIIIIAICSGIIIISKDKNKPQISDKYQELKNYKDNEYIPVYISDNDMAKIYLNDFISTAITDPQVSYSLLDDEYRNLKYPTYQSYYENYILGLDLNVTMSKFYKESDAGYLYFGVYDNKENLYIFKTKGVMQYKVYLDDYTVKIGD